MTSLLPFYHLMKDEGMIPIMGCEFYYVNDPLLKSKENRKANHLILIAKNYDGFQNLLKLSKLSFTEGFYFRPRIGLEWITKYSEGLICLSACQGGVLSAEVFREISAGLSGRLETKFDAFSKIFGEDFYVEFQGHSQDGQATVNRAFYDRLRSRTGFQHVITNDCHYIDKEHSKIQSAIKDMAYGKSESGQSYTSCDSLWLKTPKEMWETFRRNHEYLPPKFVVEGMSRTEEILDKVSGFELPKNKKYLPIFRKKYDSLSIFRAITSKALKDFLSTKKLKAPKAEYITRFKKEYGVITKNHLEDYFLIVWDIVRFAKSKNIYTGLGRGSAAGCLISYLLGIVRIDPLQYDLIFERFLNEHRCRDGELPDIDLDFESDRRGEIKDYIFKTYGRDKVCEIGTYGRMKLKTSIIDFGKSMGIASHKELLEITTKLDLDKDDTDSLEVAVNESPKLKSYMTANLDYAYAVEEIIGQIKSQSIHPAGMVICSDPIDSITPIKTQKNKESDERVITTQAEDKYIIRQGLMKMDILGLKEYDIIKFVLSAPAFASGGYGVNDYVEKIMGLEEDSPNKKVWGMFQAGRSDGVFQFSSDGMKDLLKMMQPDCINDLIAANALYRPGCLENNWHIQYCDRKHGREKVEYVHKDLEKALSSTYGTCVFQEQFMSIIHLLGNINLVESDIIRSALGKKDKKKLKKFRSRFIKGASLKIGVSEAEGVWGQIEKASNYSFNRSHSAAYSVLAYISQFLKVTAPDYFWAAHLEWDTRKNRQEETAKHKKAAAEMGVSFNLPDINKSKASFYVGGDGPVWSFRGVKGIGEKCSAEIEQNQPYKNFDDFYKRVNKRKTKFNNIESLIYAGAFDEMGDRREMIRSLYSKKKKVEAPSLTDEHMMMGFYEAMGFFEQKIKTIRRELLGCITQGALEKKKEGTPVSIGGMLLDVRRIKTKSGDPMGFGILVDLDERIELTFFPAIWAKYRSVIADGKIVKIEGLKSGWGGKSNLVEVENIEEI